MRTSCWTQWLIENPLPEDLSELQRSIIDATKLNVVSGEEIRNLMETHDCSATDISEYERLKWLWKRIIVSQTKSVPQNRLVEHEEIIDSQTTVKRFTIEDGNKTIWKEVESLEQELDKAQDEIKRLLGRNIIDRIFNR